jgi:hypothetical protein
MASIALNANVLSPTLMATKVPFLVQPVHSGQVMVSMPRKGLKWPVNAFRTAEKGLGHPS